MKKLLLFFSLSLLLISGIASAQMNGFNTVSIQGKNLLKFISPLDLNGKNITNVNYLCFAGGSCNNTFSGGGAGGGVSSLSASTGIVLTPNPITTTGTIGFDTAWGDARYLQSYTETDPIAMAAMVGNDTKWSLTNTSGQMFNAADNGTFIRNGTQGQWNVVVNNSNNSAYATSWSGYTSPPASWTQDLWNTTTDIRAAQLFNTTSDIRSAQLFNTSADFVKPINSTVGQFNISVNMSNQTTWWAGLTAPLASWTQDLWNTTADIRAAQLFNTTLEIFAAVNNGTFLRFETDAIAISAMVGNKTFWDTKNTTAQMQAAINNTFGDFNISINTTKTINASTIYQSNSKVAVIGTNCTGTDKYSSYGADGKLVCTTDQTGVGGGSSGANVTTTTCSGTDKVSGINNATGVVTCTADQTGGGSSGLTLADLFASKYYWKTVGFESVTAGYTEPLVPTAISAGTTALVAGTPEHPGIASISTSATASSGYAYQITGATTYSLSNDYTSEISFMPFNKTGNVTVLRLGFMDAYALVLPVDGVYFNATQINATYFTIRGETRSNSVQTNTATSYNTTALRWLTGKIYINSSSLATFSLSNGTMELWRGTVASNIPTGVGRETSFAIVGYTSGITTAQVLAQIDYVTIGINRALIR